MIERGRWRGDTEAEDGETDRDTENEEGVGGRKVKFNTRTIEHYYGDRFK